MQAPLGYDASRPTSRDSEQDLHREEIRTRIKSYQFVTLPRTFTAVQTLETRNR